MSTKDFIHLAFCIVVVALSLVQSDRRFCGKDLSDALSLVCDAGYNWKTEKRTALPYYVKRAGKSNLRNMLSRQLQPGRRGVVDECCYRSCSFSTMRTYCVHGSNDVELDKLNELLAFQNLPGMNLEFPTTRAPITTTTSQSKVSTSKSQSRRKHNYIFNNMRPESFIEDEYDYNNFS